MPVDQGTTTKDGKRMGFYRWGTNPKAHKYLYKLDNERSRKAALAKVKKQARAIKRSQNMRGG